MNGSWADEVQEFTLAIEVDQPHPSIPRPNDVYDRFGRNMSAQARREKLWGRWIIVKRR